MKQLAFIKRANSKGKLAKAVINYQQALLHYAKEENWVLKTNELSHVVGKLLLDMGEEFRLSHPELLDTYEASLDGEIVWVGDDDPTYVANLVLGKVKPKISNEELKKDRSMPPLGNYPKPEPGPIVREPDKPLPESQIKEPSLDQNCGFITRVCKCGAKFEVAIDGPTICQKCFVDTLPNEVA